jgi:murein DD-endopeptidase MepM/ murein hydrolase activator NlpD
MKHAGKWSFYLISLSRTEVKRIKIPRIIIIVMLFIVMASFVGFIRTIQLLCTYGYARFGLYNEQLENRELNEKLKFLNKFAEDYNNKIQTLVAFEDKARMKFGMNTITDDIRQAGVGGPPSLEQIVSSWMEEQTAQSAFNLHKKVSALLRQVMLQDSTFSRMSNHVKMQHDRWAQCPSIWPCRGRITSGFGYRKHPFMGMAYFHEGLDIAGPVWTPIFVTADGFVTFVGYRGNYGTSVFVNHRGSGYTTVYAHLRQPAVVEGQVVKRGELVGYLGNSGRSTGPHLHYEVRKFNRFDDPMKYILPMDHIVD